MAEPVFKTTASEFKLSGMEEPCGALIAAAEHGEERSCAGCSKRFVTYSGTSLTSCSPHHRLELAHSIAPDPRRREKRRAVRPVAKIRCLSEAPGARCCPQPSAHLPVTYSDAAAPRSWMMPGRRVSIVGEGFHGDTSLRVGGRVAHPPPA